MKSILNGCVVCLFILTLAGTALCQDSGNISDVGIDELGWLEGKWEGEFEGNPFEAVYTDAKGGYILSASKEYLKDDKCFIEFERFEKKDGIINLIPYPGGEKSVSFTLAEFDKQNQKVKFVNYGHDFPTEIEYHRKTEDSLFIAVGGIYNGTEKTLSIELALKKID